MPVQQMNTESESSLTEGYCIKIEVLPDGFTVSDPLPLETKSEESVELDESTEDEYSDEAGDVLPDLTSMLKAVMSVVNDNPLQESEQAGFDGEEEE